MNPTASIVNIHFSIEKFLWENIASQEGVLLIHQDDSATRLEELLATDRAVVWHYTGGQAENKGELTLYVGATTIKDPGSINRLNLLDKIKYAFDANAGIAVYHYVDGQPTDLINELAIIGPVSFWPSFTDPSIRFTTKHISQKLKFAQKRI